MTGPTGNDIAAAQRRHAANRLVLQLARHGTPWVGLFAFTALALAAGETALPAVLGRAIDAAVGHHAPRSWLLWLGLLVAALGLLHAPDDLASGAPIARSTSWLPPTLVGHVLALEPGHVARFGPGE